VVACLQNIPLNGAEQREGGPGSRTSRRVRWRYSARQNGVVPLTRDAIEELKALHRRETGESLTDDQAWAMGRRLLRVYAWLLRPPTGDPEARERFDPRLV